MRLSEVRIVNFRSIQRTNISFAPSCRTLVGINESGKSNILRALSLISQNNTPTAEDLREPLPGENPLEDAYVYFVFKLSEENKVDIYGRIAPEVLTNDMDRPIVISGEKELSLRDFCETKNDGLYCVELMPISKGPNFWSAGSQIKMPPGWMKPSSDCPPTALVVYKGIQQPLKQFKLVYQPDCEDVPANYLSPATVADLNTAIGVYIKDLVTQAMPTVVEWKYDESHLLPPSISMDDFVANPDCCLPLKSMFMLAGIKDIPDELKKVRAQAGNKLRNLLQRVAGHATEHFKSIWKEYKGIRFALEPNGNNIEANIVEKNYWRMSQRSDGFKRFMAFLLYVSANVKANKVSNMLLLIDEPDMGLHPSGARYLRDELIALSKQNLVVLSTHSIFMIDKDCIERHMIVEKDNEKTSVKSANNSNFVDEEVLFNALNYSVFDIIKKDNIIFEGWRDKRLFQVAMEKLPSNSSKELKAFKARVKNIGLCHADGVKDIRNLGPLLELAGRNCFIMSDSDKAARQKQKEYRDTKQYGDWMRYDEIDPRQKADTGEDFVTEAAFKAAVTKLKKTTASLNGDPAVPAVGRLTAVKMWLAQQDIAGDKQKELLSDLKFLIFDGLQNSQVEESYFTLLDELAKKYPENSQT